MTAVVIRGSKVCVSLARYGLLLHFIFTALESSFDRQFPLNEVLLLVYCSIISIESVVRAMDISESQPIKAFCLISYEYH